MSIYAKTPFKTAAFISSKTTDLIIIIITIIITKCISPQDSGEHDRQILQIGQYTHLLPICHINSWYMA